MKNIHWPVRTPIGQRLHFGAGSDALPEEEAQKAEIQKTLGNAKAFDKGVVGSEANTQLEMSEEGKQIALNLSLEQKQGHRRSFWFRRGLNIGLLSGMLATSGLGFHLSSIKEQATDSTPRTEHNQKEITETGMYTKYPAAAALAPMSAIVGAIALLFFNCCPEWSTKNDFKDVDIIASDLKKQLNRINQLKDRFIQVEATPDDFVSRRIDTLLSEKITWASGKLSNRLLKVYDAENSSVRPHFDRIFGSREQMPSAQEIENLFKYYAVQAIRADHRLDHAHLSEGSPLMGIPKVTREEFLTKTYALLKAAMNTGDIYNFVMKDENDPLYEQTYNMEMVGMMCSVESQVRQEFSGIRELASRETEIRQYLHKATNRLIPLKLAEEETDKSENPDIQELEGLIARLKDKQKTILSMIGEESPAVALPAEDVARLKAEVISTLQETKAFLAELDQTVADPAHDRTASALSELQEAARPGVKRAQTKTS